MPKQIHVFISSTFRDLVEERKAVIETIQSLQFSAIAMEEYIATDKKPLAAALADIAQCDIFLLIIGELYGTLDSNSNKSYIELEYDYALQSGKPILCFIQENESSSEIKNSNSGQLYEFKQKVLSNNIVSSWTSVKDLTLKITSALARYQEILTIPDETGEVETTWDENKFSNSVNTVLNSRRVLNGAAIGDVFEEFTNLHPEYGSLFGTNSNQKSNLMDLIGEFKKNSLFKPLHAADWARLLTEIYDVKINSFSINGRMFVIGALLAQFSTPELFEQNKQFLEKGISVIEELAEEHKSDGDGNPFTFWLRPDWIATYQKLINGEDIKDLSGQTGNNIIDTNNLSDYPSKDDSLSRKSLAQYLAKRVQVIYDRDVQKAKLGSYFMMLDGPWGSGKSTLLGFIKNVLEQGFTVSDAGNSDLKPQKWIVVNFNAWENQRLDPPWWFLMKGVYSEIATNLKKDEVRSKWTLYRFILNEYKWRFSTGTNNLWAVGVTFALFIAALILGITDKKEFEHLWVPATATFIGFLWSLTKFLRTSLVPGSAKAAQSFIEEYGKDPMQVLATHFKKQIELAEKPVAIFIDDMDRCNKEYGIKLLEGLQTIFRKAPVIYVIAADKKWLSTMYEKQYEMFSPVISKPTKPFGLIFLDKIFQWTIELPNVSVFHKRTYWNFLLNIADPTKEQATEKEIENINKAVKNAVTNSDKISLAKTNISEQHQQVTREAIISSISIKEEDKKLEHKLQDFIDLVEPNPRSMKRLINDISTAKTMSFLYKQNVQENQLILWCILKLQHPIVADFFWNNPADFEGLIYPKDNLPPTKNLELFQILEKTDVKKLFVFSVNGETIKLDLNFIEEMKFNK